jgi:DNA-binding response OmpR family regulator
MASEQRLLIVEDDRNACDALAELMESEGYRVTTAADGSAALAELSAHTFGVVITDLQMPRMGGLQLLREMRARKLSPSIIVMTARGTEAAEQQARQLGAIGFVHKPVDLGELIALVQSAFAGR